MKIKTNKNFVIICCIFTSCLFPILASVNSATAYPSYEIGFKYVKIGTKLDYSGVEDSWWLAYIDPADNLRDLTIDLAAEVAADVLINLFFSNNNYGNEPYYTFELKTVSSMPGASIHYIRIAHRYLDKYKKPMTRYLKLMITPLSKHVQE